MENNEAAVTLLKKAYEMLKKQDPKRACALLEQALDIDYENDEIKHALKCVHWWLGSYKRVELEKTNYDKGGHLISLLKQYQIFLEQLEDINNQYIYDQCQYAIRYFVYSKALSYFEEILKQAQAQSDQDPILLLLVGRCYKGLGDYEKALQFLEHAFRLKKTDSQILAEVADVNALLQELKTAKALFREAFFVNPLVIELEYLESALIVKLINDVQRFGYTGLELNAWIPVYGYLWGVFNVRRELKQTEAGRLKQSIFSMEAEYEANPQDTKRRSILKPRIINHYFWLIDHYENTREDSAFIEETLLKIKIMDPGVYKIYTGQTK